MSQHGCDGCGTLIELEETYCEACGEQVIECYECGYTSLNNDSFTWDDSGHAFCESCTIECEKCGKIEPLPYSHTVNDNGEKYYCEECYQIFRKYTLKPTQLTAGGNWYVPNIVPGMFYNGPFDSCEKAQHFIDSIL